MLRFGALVNRRGTTFSYFFQKCAAALSQFRSYHFYERIGAKQRIV